MSKIINIFKGSNGLNNVADNSRVRFNPETGLTELATAYNVDIDDFGRISRRPGFATTARTESIHSLFSGDFGCFFISGDSLYRLGDGYTKTGLRSGLTLGARMSFLPTNFRTYYSNGYELGYIIDNTSYAWVVDTYTGPPTTEVFSSPPAGTHLELYNGRIYTTVGNQLYYSEPFAFSWFNLASGYVWFKDKLRFVRSVSDGIFVGSNTGVVFLAGRDPKEFQVLRISSGVPVEFTDVKLDGVFVGAEEKVVMWTATDGIWVGTNGGRAKNLTSEKIVYPGSNIGSGVVYNNKYISLLEE